ncbi:hypothetical protein BGW80DRAFT_910614 [Lactifluus volemus]|nr:hypothetical protein BGW80DRAFT_910614 [Lactifluus volemus]
MFSKSLVVSLFFLGLTSSINAIPVPRDVGSDAPLAGRGIFSIISDVGDVVGLIDDGLNIAQTLGAGPSSQSTSGTKRQAADDGGSFPFFYSGGDLGSLINVELGSPSQSTSNKNLKRSLGGLNFKQIASDAGNVLGIVGDAASLANAFGLVSAPASPSAGQKRAFGGLNFHNIASDVNNVLGVVSDGITLGQDFGIVPPPASLSAGQKRAFGGLNLHNIASDVNNVLGVVASGVTLGQDFGIVPPPTQATTSAGQKREGEALEG